MPSPNLTDAYGRQSYILPAVEGKVPIKVRQTATTAAGAVVWGVGNISGGKTIVVPKIVFQLSFDGTGAATDMIYELVKADSVTVFSGGAVTPVSIDSVKATFVGTYQMLDTGLTTTGIAHAAQMEQITWARLTHSATQAGGQSDTIVWDFTEFSNGGIVLHSGEVLVLRNGPTNASVVGDCVYGTASVIEY